MNTIGIRSSCRKCTARRMVNAAETGDLATREVHFIVGKGFFPALFLGLLHRNNQNWVDHEKSKLTF
jgi:hypothetical protein